MTIFVQSQYLPSVLTEMFTNDSSSYAIIDFLYLRNNGSSAAKATLHVVPVGGTADASNKLYEETLSPDESMQGEGIVGTDLGPGDSLWALQSVASTIVMRATGRLRT